MTKSQKEDRARVFEEVCYRLIPNVDIPFRTTNLLTTAKGLANRIIAAREIFSEEQKLSGESIRNIAKDNIKELSDAVNHINERHYEDPND